ncbi:hypothetical protein LOD99_5085 [Oopsacas minuta]|uniref:Carbohydrate sulfotransferase n=1 Tax=Oopsacas minuta TaxID=111878 RepID=A0AAV7JRW1_9METZ|nr:hypothetical protein LOD99_5085 [Oopsacas minuta]
MFIDEYRNQMELKGLHPLNLKHEYLRDRIVRVVKYCKVFPTQTNGVFGYMVRLFRMRFNDNTKLLQCAVLKVSSTTWQGVQLWQKIAIEYNHDNAKITAQRFQTYTKFRIARNPLQRLLSGYTDNDFGENFVKGIIISNYLTNLTLHEIKQMRQELKTGRNN